MDPRVWAYALKRLFCQIFAHDFVIDVPARSLVNVWCARCGDPFPTKL